MNKIIYTIPNTTNTIVCGDKNIVSNITIGSKYYDVPKTVSFDADEFKIKTSEETFELISIIKELRERIQALETFIEELRMSPDMPEGKQMMEEAKKHFEESFSSSRDC
jgi:hypothetical protein